MFRVSSLVALAALATGCSRWVELGSTGEGTGGASEAPDTGTTGGQGSGGTPSPGGDGGSETGGSSTGGRPSAEACDGSPVQETRLDEAGNVCVETESEAEPTPLDVFILMDRSDSMTNVVAGGTMTRWEAIREGVSAFVNDEAVRERDIRVGLQFFALVTDNNPEINCDNSRYAIPEVPIDGLDVAGQQILDAIDATGLLLGGGTPTLPALQGAYQYTQAWAASPESGGRPAVVVLVTDGLPTECQEVSSVPDIADAAGAALLDEPSIRTLVVGLSVAEGNLNMIAQQGGMSVPVVLDSGDAAALLLDALLDITLRDLPCKYEMPDSPEADLNLYRDAVRMLYWPDVNVPDVVQEIPRAQNRAECFGSTLGGWYYHYPEDSDTPTEIHLCPCTCALFRQGFMEIQYGCIPKPV